MLDRDEALHLFEYDRWANLRALSAIAELPEPHVELQRQIAHVVGALEVWAERVAGGDYRAVAVWPPYPGHAALVERAERAWARWRERLERAEPGDFAARVSFVNSQGQACSDELGHIVRHVVNHGTHHRAQIAALLRAAGRAPLSVDYIVWTRQRA